MISHYTSSKTIVSTKTHEIGQLKYTSCETHFEFEFYVLHAILKALKDEKTWFLASYYWVPINYHLNSIPPVCL